MTLKNIAASVRQRILNRSKQENRPFQELLQYYAMERFLYRVSQSKHANDFVLKGALMLRAWKTPEARPTKDIDFLGMVSNQEDNIVSIVKTIIATDVEIDGMEYATDTVVSQLIKEDADYHGVRVQFEATLTNARIPMQIDIGFGDVITPKALKSALPTMLEFPAPELLCYSRETAIAEKFEAMIKLGTLNSRMKDFYDIWLLCRQYDFNGSVLADAIQATMKNRGTELPSEITAFTNEFISTKQVQWTAFHKRLNQNHIPADMGDIVHQIDRFISLIIKSLSKSEPFNKKWTAGKNWN